MLTFSTVDCRVAAAPRNGRYHGSIKGTRHYKRVTRSPEATKGEAISIFE